MYAITAVFGLPLLVAGAMVNPEGLHVWGLLTYAAIMLILMPFVGWPILLQAAIFAPAGESRPQSVMATWIGGTLVGVAVIFWLYSVLGYDLSGSRVDWSGHVIVPYWPRLGIALGLFGLCMLISSGVVGTIAPILRREVAISAARSFVTPCYSRSYTRLAALWWQVTMSCRRSRPAARTASGCHVTPGMSRDVQEVVVRILRKGHWIAGRSRLGRCCHQGRC
jgi:hypothetical protein